MLMVTRVMEIELQISVEYKFLKYGCLKCTGTVNIASNLNIQES